MAPYWANLEFSRSSRNFGEDLEESRNDKNIFLGESGSEKRSGTSGNGELLVPSLVGLEAIFGHGANVCFGLNVKTDSTYKNLDGFYSNTYILD